MGCENGSDVDVAFSAQGNGDACLPFMEMGYDGGSELAGNILSKGVGEGSKKLSEKMLTYLAKEPSHHITKDNSFISFMIVGRARYSREIPKVPLPLVELGVLTAGVKEQDVRGALNEPSAVESFYATGAHYFERGSKVGIGRLFLVDLHGSGLVGERADEAISVCIL